MQLKRWITSIVALPLLLILILKGGTVAFALFIGVVCMVALWEFNGIVSMDREMPWIRSPLPWITFLSAGVIIWAAHRQYAQVVVTMVAVNLIITGLVSVPIFGSRPSVVESTYKQSLGLVYIPLLLSHLVLIRSQADGISWVFLPLCVVFSGDTVAYYAGTYLGRHKLCPAVSPGKTWEGAIGGLAASLGAGALYKWLFLRELPWVPGLLLFAAIAVAGQVGDLFESELKRVAGVKDSGVLLPGHGGMLDRIDALLFAAPVAYCGRQLLIH